MLLVSRYAILTWVSVEILLFSGIVYGWSAIVFILIEEGVHSELCPTAENVTSTFTSNQSAPVSGGYGCVERDARFNLYFMLSNALSMIIVVILGHMLSKYGTRTARLCSVVVFWAGCLLFYFTDKDVPWLILPAIICLQASGLSLLATSIQICKLFPTYGRLVIAVFSGLLDSSCVVALLFKFLYQYGIPRQWTVLGFMACSLMTVFSTFVLFPATYIETPDFSKAEEHTAQNRGSGESSTNRPRDKGDSPGGLLHYLKDKDFLFYLFWFATNNLNLQLFIGIANPIISRKTGDVVSQVSHYTDVLHYVMFGGIVASLPVGTFVNNQKNRYAVYGSERSSCLRATVMPLVVTSLLCSAIYALLMLDEPRVLYAVFVDVTIARAILYTVAAMALMELFPQQSYGVLQSFTWAVGGLVSQSQNGLFYWTEAYHEAFFHMNLVLVFLGLLSLLYPVYIFKKARDEKQLYKDAKPKDLNIFNVGIELTRL